MTISKNDLHKIARLAYLEPETEEMEKLALEVNAIIDFVQQLQGLDTAEVHPLFHPLNLKQRLRDDEITEQNCIDELASIAPQFENDLYLVPKFVDVDTGQ
ncbi:glutamyl/tRNA (Gln) amidotransferase subunit C [Legionella beliardensis]|uniref:Aspartyl/glutamyl-tRNA(Asn/Gln) amidotransferase subunit C n=1 Tax=Legionella beliardensis TaxID=91822 RepID=A0A378I3L3_9GAMM|nr:Asp-tRNA(Asn)/Glu-tRNA(Gln) amidotransferase subunit GatC [Legionella beliardensis]STX29291.1 glutamyl/tRNA (Gln) amidotransferase subunit C [Legionella beliardensis]